MQAWACVGILIELDRTRSGVLETRNLFAGAWTLWRLEISLWTRCTLGCLLENIFVAPSNNDSSSSKKAIFLCLPMATFLLLPVRVNAAPTFRISQPAPCSPWCVFSLSIGLIYSRESRLVFREISLRDLNIFFLRYDFPEVLKTGCKWDVTPKLETLYKTSVNLLFFVQFFVWQDHVKMHTMRRNVPTGLPLANARKTRCGWEATAGKPVMLVSRATCPNRWTARTVSLVHFCQNCGGKDEY